MGPMLDEKCWMEVMDSLAAYTHKVFQECVNLQTASNACVSNMGADVSAQKSANKLQKCIVDIQSGVNEINRIRSAMQQELEDWKKTQQIIND